MLVFCTSEMTIISRGHISWLHFMTLRTLGTVHPTDPLVFCTPEMTIVSRGHISHVQILPDDSRSSIERWVKPSLLTLSTIPKMFFRPNSNVTRSPGKILISSSGEVPLRGFHRLSPVHILRRPRKSGLPATFLDDSSQIQEFSTFCPSWSIEDSNLRRKTFLFSCPVPCRSSLEFLWYVFVDHFSLIFRMFI